MKLIYRSSDKGRTRANTWGTRRDENLLESGGAESCEEAKKVNEDKDEDVSRLPFVYSLDMAAARRGRGVYPWCHVAGAAAVHPGRYSTVVQESRLHAREGRNITVGGTRHLLLAPPLSLLFRHFPHSSFTR